MKNRRYPELCIFTSTVLKGPRTKTQTIRHIDMNPTLIELFTRLKLNREGSDYVFTNPNTGKSFKWISHSWHRLLKRCKIDPPGRFHDLRHTAATRALERGASIVSVQHLLGHQNVSTTSRYSHATDKGKKEAVNLIDFGEPR
jgi:integrase